MSRILESELTALAAQKASGRVEDDGGGADGGVVMGREGGRDLHDDDLQMTADDDLHDDLRMIADDDLQMMTSCPGYALGAHGRRAGVEAAAQGVELRDGGGGEEGAEASSGRGLVVGAVRSCGSAALLFLLLLLIIIILISGSGSSFVLLLLRLCSSAGSQE